MNSNFLVRPARVQDHHEIANLMFFERKVHRHLDWRHPTDWLGSPFYWVLEKHGRIVAVLACPMDQKEITWIRLFAHAGQIPSGEAWTTLWQTAKSELGKFGNIKVAAISLKSWVKTLLEAQGFQNDEQIIMMVWKDRKVQEWTLPNKTTIREMTDDDLPNVALVDEAAFTHIWQNSLSMLEQAYPQAVVATVAETADGIIGYQFSTASPFGAHLARLAVHPQAQRLGVASALIGDLTNKLLSKKIEQLSVNTQSKNLRSLALYKKCGFSETGEEYPLYTFQVSGEGETQKEPQWDTVKMQ